MQLFNLETIRLGLNSLKLHKLRSLLTSLGIIFGVAAVICMLSISEGASADELRMIELLGTKNIIVNSVKPPTTAQNTQSNSNMHAIKLSVKVLHESSSLKIVPKATIFWFFGIFSNLEPVLPQFPKFCRQ